MNTQPDHHQPRFGEFGTDAPDPQPASQRLSWLAMSSLVTGLLALPICCVPFGGSIFGLLPILLGIGGLLVIRRARGALAGKSMAIVGLVLGILGAGVSTIAWTAIGGQLSAMPSVYSQVLDSDPDVARTVLANTAAAKATDEELERFHAAFVAEYGDSIKVTTGLAPMIQSYLKAGSPEALQSLTPQPGTSPFPMPIETQQGWAYVFVFMKQGETLGSGLPVLANACFPKRDGTMVWLFEPAGNATLPATDSQSPTPDNADTEKTAPDKPSEEDQGG